MTFCPDCKQEIPDDEFVTHREESHPPEPRVLTTAGIDSKMRFGTDPEE